MTTAGRPRKTKESIAERDERLSRGTLMGTSRGLRFGRGVLRRLPSEPRCKLCASPFKGAFGPVVRLLNGGPWPGNPKYCSACFKDLVTHRGGAEIECSLLFADVRDSTPLAEAIGPTRFRELMDRFFQTAAKVLFEHDAIVDKFVGDEVIGIFIPALTGELHARRAIDAGRELLAATGHATGQPWVPLGVGINTGVAFVGTVGQDDHVEFTALGDPVNVTARVTSAAGIGELLATAAAARAAQLTDAGLEHRTLTLKGKSEPTDVLVLHA
jgi:adenylate cyclase